MQYDDPTFQPDLLQWLASDSYLLQLTLDTLPVPIFYKDIHGVYLGCNEAFETFIKLTREELVGKSVYQLFDKDLADVYQTADKTLFDNPGVQTYEKLIKSQEGDELYVKFHKTSFNNKQGQVAGLIGVIFDITEQKALEAKLIKHAIYDDLTGLYNRREGIRIGEERYQLADNGEINLGLIMIDIDYFKDINDEFGHLTGDEALRHIAKTLQRYKHMNDVIMRWGGEEFLIIVKRDKQQADQEDFHAYMNTRGEHYRSAIKRHQFSTHQRKLVITLSCGICAYKANKSLNQMLHDADEALYRAKSQGRDKVCW